jgi:hypothetical protein
LPAVSTSAIFSHERHTPKCPSKRGPGTMSLGDHAAVSRRDFLKTTSATTGLAALAGMPALNRILSPDPRDPLLIGHGDHVYTMNHQWAKLPAGKRFGYTHGIVEDKAGRFLIANQSRDAIMIFDPHGNFISSWGQAYAKGAHGLRIEQEKEGEVLYLANTSLAEVVKTTLDGDVIWKAGRPYLAGVYTQDRAYSPTETALGPNGLLYVADGYGQSWIHVYDARDGKYLDSFGGKGSEKSSLDQPHGISIDARDGTPVLQIADRQHVRIANFTLDGKFVDEPITRTDLRFPCTTFHRGGLLYVPDLFARVSIFDRGNRKIIDLGDYVDGKPLTSWDDFGKKYAALAGYPNLPPEKRTPNKFISPHALWVDQAGNIYVVEWVEDGRVTKLTKQ